MSLARILAINTTTLQYGLAVLEVDGAVVVEEIHDGRNRRFGGFMPVLDRMLRASRTPAPSLTGVAVATGPGSFTGLRVGLSAAKGLCHALGIAIIGVSSLEALAHQVPFASLPVCALVDSRRGEFFVARFSTPGNGPPERLTEDTCLGPSELGDPAFQDCLWIGNDYRRQAPLLRETLGHNISLAPPQCWHLRASSVGALALGRLERGDADDLGDLKPTYHRPPDIRPNPYPPRKGFDTGQGH